MAARRPGRQDHLTDDRISSMLFEEDNDDLGDLSHNESEEEEEEVVETLEYIFDGNGILLETIQPRHRINSVTVKYLEGQVSDP